MKIQYIERKENVVEMDLEFPYYIKDYDSDTLFFVTRVNADLSYVELFKESPDHISYNFRFGDEYIFYARCIQEDIQQENKTLFYNALKEIKDQLNSIPYDLL